MGAGGRIVYGVNPVRELVSARPRGVTVVYLAAGRRDPSVEALCELCRNRGVAFEEREPAELDELAGAGARHQGVVAIAGEYQYAELDDVLDDVEARAQTPLVVVLDGVMDPHNLGAIVRSAHLLGAHAVVIPKDRAAPVTPAAVKASAGATERLPVARVTNVARALEGLKARGLWTVGAVMDDAPLAAEVDLRGPIGLVVGGEARGLRPLVRRSCDLLARIPMSGIGVGSLNVSVATGILLYEAARQRAGK